MALNITNKASSQSSSTPSRTVERSQVKMGTPLPSTARVEALKARLTGKPSAQPIAPRQAGSTARQEALSKATKFTTDPQSSQVQPKTGSRAGTQDFSDMAPPPSGLAPGSVEVIPVATTVEAPPKAVEAPNESTDPQFDALARQARQVRRAQQELKAAQEAWKQEQANYVPKARLSSETLKVLAEAGITPDKLLELQTQQAESADPNQPLLDRISQLESKLLEVTDPENGTLAKDKRDSYNAAIQQIRNDATLLVDSDPNYGLIKSEGQTEEIVKLIDAVFEAEGIALDVEEAAQAVEAKLAERLVKQYERISKYDKIKAKFGQPAEQAEANTTQQSPQSQSPKTLTNAGAAQRQLSPRERAILRVQEAIDAKKGR